MTAVSSIFSNYMCAMQTDIRNYIKLHKFGSESYQCHSKRPYNGGQHLTEVAHTMLKIEP